MKVSYRYQVIASRNPSRTVFHSWFIRVPKKGHFHTIRQRFINPEDNLVLGMDSVSVVRFETISRRLRERTDLKRDFSIVRNDNMFRAGFANAPVFESDYVEIADYLNNLSQSCEGLGFEEVFPGNVIQTGDGPAYDIVTRIPLDYPVFTREEVISRILSCLTLVRGIGQATERSLRMRGCRSVRDLLHSRRYRGQAVDIIRTAENGSAVEVSQLLSGWLPGSHPLMLLGSSLHDTDRVVFLDLETLGFFNRPIILIGIGVIRKDLLEVHQIILKDIDEEPAALEAARSYLNADSVVMSYNGKAFDIPYLRERYAYYGERPPQTAVHYDLLHAARRQYRCRIPDCRLSTLEKHLFSVERGTDVPSSMVPECYERYRSTTNAGVLVPVVAHNLQDIISLAMLAGCLIRDAYDRC